AALLERPGEVQPVHLAAREVPDALLLVRSLEVEHRAIRARGNLTFAEDDLVLPARDLIVDGFAGVGPVAVLVDVGGDDRLADRELARVRLLLTHDHLEERRLAGAVGADDADDAAPRQVEGEVVDEEAVAVGLPHALGPDDDVAQAR